MRTVELISKKQSAGLRPKFLGAAERAAGNPARGLLPPVGSSAVV